MRLKNRRSGLPELPSISRRRPAIPQPAWIRDISTALARSKDIIRLSRSLTARSGRSDRLARIASLFTFVSQVVDTPDDPLSQPRDGIDELMRLVGRQRGPAVALAALLQSAGEHVQLQEVAGVCFVQVEIEVGDVSRLPPFAQPVESHGRIYLPLDPRRSRAPMGFVPLWVRQRASSREC